MADYTDIAAVRSVLPEGVKIDDVDALKVTELCGLVTNRVNVALAIGNVDLPLSDPELEGDLDLLCRKEVAYQWMSSVRGGTAEDPKAVPIWKTCHKDFEDALKLMREGKYTATVGVEGGPESYTMDAEESGEPDQQPQITRGRKF